jgi:hypothetical protein
MRIKQLYDLFRYDIPRFIKNVFIYRKALWRTYNFDYSGSLYFLRTHLEQLEPVLRNGHHVRGDKVADKAKTCKLLLDRILDSTEQYNLEHLSLDFSGRSLKVKYVPKNSEHLRHGSKLYWEVIKNKEQQDWTLLMKMLYKHQRSFWD